MMLRGSLTFLLLAMCLTLQAQLVDSIRHDLQQKPTLVVKLDGHGSFISNETVNFIGFKIGREHAGRVQYGIGYSFLLTPVEHEQVVEGEGMVTTRLRLGYVTPYFDYAFYQKGPWELRLPVQFGIGSGSVVYDGTDGNSHTLKRGLIFLYEPCMTVQYRFLKYFAIGGGWGFRLVLSSSVKLNDGLTAPIYTYGLRVFFGDLWKDVMGKE